MHDDNFSPDNIERLPDASSHKDARLLSELQAAYQPLAESHTRSLQRVRARLAQREVLGRPQSHNVQSQKQPILLASEWNLPEGKMRTIKEKEAMKENNVSRGMRSSMPLSQPKKRNSFLRVAGLSLVAAVAIITILSFTIFSGILRSGHQTAGKQPSSITGAVPQQTQKAISDGKLACSFDAGTEVVITNLPWEPHIAWSSQGEIAVTNYASVRAYSAQNCASATLSQSSIQRAYGALWSPDGKKLLVGDVGDNSAYVLNRQGNIITHLSNVNMAGSMWSSDSTKITLPSIGSSQTLDRINSVDLSNGNKITTLATFPESTDVGLLSPDGKVALVYQVNVTQIDATHFKKSLSPSIWDVKSGKKISDLPSALTEHTLGMAFSPDGSQFAVSVPGAIQIYNTANGHLLTSIADTSSANEVHVLAWSPNGRYLAESVNAVKIYDVNAKKLVTTFGAVDAQHQIVSLAWAPDTTGIASTTIVLADGVPDDNMVNVWTLN